jgi:hypothetical protein
MPPRKKKTFEFSTTEEFANFIREKMKDKKCVPELCEIIVKQWGLSHFSMPKKEITDVRDYAHDNNLDKDICANLNSVSYSI